MTVEGLLEAHAGQRDSIRERVLSIVLREWDGLGSWDRSDVERFTAKVVPLVKAGQTTTAAITDAYVARVLAEISAETIPAVGVTADSVTGLRGVDAAAVYTRPFVNTWTGLKGGARFADALVLGRDRLARLVDDDLTLAYRAQASQSMSARGVERYRRVTRPEMSKTGSCVLCGIASEHEYRTDRLMPIHTRCSCAVMPVLGSGVLDPGARLNAEDDHQNPDGVAVQVHEHGELGPVLAVAGQAFDVAA